MAAGSVDSAEEGAELLYDRAWRTASAGSRRAIATRSAKHGRLAVTLKVRWARLFARPPDRFRRNERQIL